MAEGFFIVRQSETDQRDIIFETRSGGAEPPSDQLELKSDVERTLVVLQMMFEADRKKFFQAFFPLLSLAQCGLVGPSAQPQVAKLALIELKNEVTSREAGNVKNQYLRTLGRRAFFFAAPAVFLWGLLYYLLGPNPMSSFCALWTGCMIGVWLSFGARKTIMRFEELSIPESDRLEPSIRLVFAGLLTLILGLLFFKQAVVVTVGSVATSGIGDDFIIALIVGCLAGFSELALPSKVAKQAAMFLDDK